MIHITIPITHECARFVIRSTSEDAHFKCTADTLDCSQMLNKALTEELLDKDPGRLNIIYPGKGPRQDDRFTITRDERGEFHIQCDPHYAKILQEHRK